MSNKFVGKWQGNEKGAWVLGVVNCGKVHICRVLGTWSAIEKEEFSKLC